MFLSAEGATLTHPTLVSLCLTATADAAPMPYHPCTHVGFAAPTRPPLCTAQTAKVDEVNPENMTGVTVTHTGGRKITTVVATTGPSPGTTQELSYADTTVIGNGSFGVVFQVNLLATGERVAIKKVLQDKRFKVSRLIPPASPPSPPDCSRPPTARDPTTEHGVVLDGPRGIPRHAAPLRPTPLPHRCHQPASSSDVFFAFFLRFSCVFFLGGAGGRKYALTS